MNKSKGFDSYIGSKEGWKGKGVGKSRAGRGSFNVYWQDVIFQLISGFDEFGQI